MEHLTLRTETDTATPRPVIPIFLIHSIDAPFCNLPGCWCHPDKANLAPFLAAIQNGELTVHMAASFWKRKETPMTPKNVSVGTGTIIATRRDFIEGYQAGHLSYMAARASHPHPYTDEEITAMFFSRLEDITISDAYSIGFIAGFLHTLAVKGIRKLSLWRHL